MELSQTGSQGAKVNRIHPSDVIIGGTVGLVGFYIGLSRSVTIMLGAIAVAASIGATYLYRRWKAKGV